MWNKRQSIKFQYFHIFAFFRIAYCPNAWGDFHEINCIGFFNSFCSIIKLSKCFIFIYLFQNNCPKWHPFFTLNWSFLMQYILLKTWICKEFNYCIYYSDSPSDMSTYLRSLIAFGCFCNHLQTDPPTAKFEHFCDHKNPGEIILLFWFHLRKHRPLPLSKTNKIWSGIVNITVITS